MDISKFKLAESLNGPSGKSSLTLLMSFIWGLIGGLMMITAIIGAFFGMPFYSEIFTYGGLMVGASASLLGVRRITASKQEINIDKEEIKENI